MRLARLRRAAGFTFVELMIVITLLGLMASVVVANLDGLTDRSTLNACAREFGNMLTSVRDQAALQQRELVVEIDIPRQQWRFVDAPPVTDVPDPKDREEQTFRSDWNQVRPGVIMDAPAFGRSDRQAPASNGVISITFDSEGQIFPSGFVSYFRSGSMDAEDGVSVEVTGLTGLVDYERGRKVSEEVRSASDF